MCCLYVCIKMKNQGETENEKLTGLLWWLPLKVLEEMPTIVCVPSKRLKLMRQTEIVCKSLRAMTVPAFLEGSRYVATQKPSFLSAP